MKKLFFLVATAAMIIFTACGNQAKASAESDSATSESTEQTDDAAETKPALAEGVTVVEYFYELQDKNGETLCKYELETPTDSEESAVLTIESPDISSWFRWVNRVIFDEVRDMLVECGAADFKSEYNGDADGEHWSYYVKFSDGTKWESSGVGGAKEQLDKINQHLHEVYKKAE